jgi:glycerate-2-kinase
MILLNKKDLAATPLRADACAIIESAYEALDIEKTIARKVCLRGTTLSVAGARPTRVDVSRFHRIFIVGVGKDADVATIALADVFKNHLTRAIALAVRGTARGTRVRPRVEILYGTHPEPSHTNVQATEKIVSLLSDVDERDFVLFFVGGGGSSLLCATESERRAGCAVFPALTKMGATIEEMNIVRKHLSEVKGGKLARLTYPASSLSLIVSDVCGNDLDTIASGPTVYDRTTIADALHVLTRYGVSPEGLVFVETPKDKKIFSKVKAVLLACNQDAAVAMVAAARQRGYAARIVSLALQGEAKTALIPFVRKIKKGEALVCAGETTVHVRGNGTGGRNQEAALGVLDFMMRHKKETKGIVAASFASDARDNNTAVAGALVDTVAVDAVKKKKINPKKFLSRNDSYHFFERIGGYIRARRTAFNVSDLMLIMKEKRE